MLKKAKNRILQIREDHEWKSVVEIIRSKSIDRKDRLFLIAMSIFTIPLIIICRLLWILFYIPAKLFEKLDDMFCT